MRRILTLTVVALMVATAFSASAFTTGYVDRTASINVVADGNGIIQLDDGTSGDIVGISNDELTIDFANESASGANTNASFELGDPNDANNASAFNITNTGNAKQLTLEYTLDNNDPSSGAENVNFTVYDGSGAKQITASDETGESSTYSISSSETVYVVITVDTTNVSTAEVLDGTLRIKLAE